MLISSRQDAVESAMVDLKIKFEQQIPAKTNYYCSILHDQILTYRGDLLLEETFEDNNL